MRPTPTDTAAREKKTSGTWGNLPKVKVLENGGFDTKSKPRVTTVLMAS